MTIEPDRLRQLKERHRQGAALAETLVGLSRSDAVERLTAAGFEPQIVTPDVDALTLDLRFERVRVWVDETELVTRAEAG